MINFRYHIVSLMAVFIALSVGIAVGVSLGPSVDQGLLRQAEQDRKQVTELRAEINRRNALDEYREAYDEQAGEPVIDGALRGVRVALVTHARRPRPGGHRSSPRRWRRPEAPWSARSRSDPDAFDPARSEALTEALGGLADQIPLNEDDDPGREGRDVALARSIASPQVEDRDQLALALGTALTRGGFVTISRGTDAQAQLVIVVTAAATDPPADADRARRPRRVRPRPRGPGRGGARRAQQHRDRGHRRAGGPLGPAGQPTC